MAENDNADLAGAEPGSGCGTADDGDCRSNYLGQIDAFDWVEQPGGDVVVRIHVLRGVVSFLEGRSDALPAIPGTLRALFRSKVKAGELRPGDEPCWCAGARMGLTTVGKNVTEAAGAMNLGLPERLFAK